jgi:hypothetical protein
LIAENEKLVGELRLALTDSTTVIYPDNKAGGDAYWNMEKMITQVRNYHSRCRQLNLFQ